MRKLFLHLILSLALIFLVGQGQSFGGGSQRWGHPAPEFLQGTALSCIDFREAAGALSCESSSSERNHQRIASHVTTVAEEEDESASSAFKRKCAKLQILTATLRYFGFGVSAPAGPSFFYTRHAYTSSIRHHLIFRVFRI